MLLLVLALIAAFVLLAGTFCACALFRAVARAFRGDFRPMRTIALALAALLAVIGIALWLTRPLSDPAVFTLQEPRVLIEDLPFDGDVTGLVWSRDGRGLTISGWSHDPTNRLAIVDERVQVRIGAGVASLEAGQPATVPLPSDQPEAPDAPGKVLQTYRDSGGTMVTIRGTRYDEDPTRWRIEVRRRYRRPWAADLGPHDTDGHASPGEAHAFAPDGTRLAFTIRSGFGADVPGKPELWILDLEDETLRYVCDARYDWTAVWEYDVQELHPVWSPDSRTIYFGDGAFGVEAIDAETGDRRKIFEPEWGGRAPAVSPDGRWLGFCRPARGERRERMAVGSVDGRRWAQVPDEFACWRVSAWVWHPTDNVLVWAGGKNPDSLCCLFLWTGEGPRSSVGK